MDWSGGPQVPKGSGKLPLERGSRGKGGAGKATETLQPSLIFLPDFYFYFCFKIQSKYSKMSIFFVPRIRTFGYFHTMYFSKLIALPYYNKTCLSLLATPVFKSVLLEFKEPFLYV